MLSVNIHILSLSSYDCVSNLLLYMMQKSLMGTVESTHLRS